MQKLLLGILFLVATHVAFSQFKSTVGAGALFGTGKVQAGAPAGTESPTFLAYGLSFYPRKVISETGSGSISVGLPMVLGASGSVGVNSRTGAQGSGFNFTVHLPVTIDYNLGYNMEEDDDRTFGGFIGGGFSFTYNSTSVSTFGSNGIVGSEKSTTYGPMIHAGARAVIGSRSYELKASYSLGLEKLKFRTIGVTLSTSL